MSVKQLSSPTAEGATKSCWICYDNSANPTCRDDWIEPCRCIGSTRWVHHRCLSQWIDRAEGAGISITNEADNVGFFSLSPAAIRRKPVCPQCRMTYTIVARRNPFLFALDYAKLLYDKVLVVVAAVGAASGIYLIAFSYGYAVCLAVYGADDFMNLFHFYLGSDSPLLQQAQDQFSVGWNRSVEFSRAAFLTRCCLGIPIIPFSIISASFRFMHWLYPTIPAIMLFGDRQIRFEWPIPERLMVSLLPMMLKGYRWLRKQVEYFLIKRILTRMVETEFEHIERNLGPEESNLYAFMRETAGIIPSSPVEPSDDALSNSSGDEEHSGEFIEQVPPRNPVSPTNSELDVAEDAVILKYAQRVGDTLFIPFIGSLFGRLLFRQNAVVKSKFYRSILGIGIVILLTDAGFMLSRYWRYKSRISRRILDFPKIL